MKKEIKVNVWYIEDDDGKKTIDEEEMMNEFEGKLRDLVDEVEKECCDNTDCVGGGKVFKKVRMKDEFDGGMVYWCDKCIERDNGMIKE